MTVQIRVIRENPWQTFLSADKTHRPRGRYEIGIIYPVARLFLQGHVLNKINKLGTRRAAAEVIAKIVFDG